MTRLIGRRCKRSNAFSRPVLIGRGLGEQFSARARYGTLKERQPAMAVKTNRARFPVTIAVGPHPFPSRTRKLRPPAPMVLGGQPPGRVGRRRDNRCETRAMAVARVFLRGGSRKLGARVCWIGDGRQTTAAEEGRGRRLSVFARDTGRRTAPAVSGGRPRPPFRATSSSAGTNMAPRAGEGLARGRAAGMSPKPAPGPNTERVRQAPG